MLLPATGLAGPAATRFVIRDWIAAPETPHSDITGIPSQDNGPVGAMAKMRKPAAPQTSPSSSASTLAEKPHDRPDARALHQHRADADHRERDANGL